MTKKKLSNLHARFVDEYMVDRNATQAAIRAGYKAKNADVRGPFIRNMPAVAAAIAEREKTIADKLGITVERILMERKRLAFYDVGLTVDKDNNPLPLSEIDVDTRAAMTGIKFDDKGGVEYKLDKKHAHLTALERHLGLDTGDTDRGGLNIHIHLE